ncbi:hypothetical protein [Aeromicrobium sp.]|uniref:hypothetical protein n=1 Tax=Aeromicrobium sp. TaxID=1871063 RepID=UPI0030BB26BD
MKWLVVIVILIVVVVGMLWLRTVRHGPDTAASQRPHRLDDSVNPAPDTAEPRRDQEPPGERPGT